MSLAMIMWGIAWTSAKIVNEYLSYPNLIFLRYLSSFLFILPLVFFSNKKISFPSIRVALNILLASLLYYIYNIAFFWGTDIGSAGLGGVFVTTTNPIITFILISIIINTINKFQVIGILVGMLGGIIILDVFTLGTSIFNSSNIAFIICSLTWGIITVIVSYGQKEYDSIYYIVFCYLVTTLIALYNVDISEIVEFSKYDLRFTIHFIIVSIGAMAFGTSVYMYSTSIIGPVESSVFIFAVPFIAIFSAFIMLNEPITYQVIIGGLLSIYAIYLVNFKK